MKKIAILQSNYIPWKGYFDIIHDVDEFIFYDEVQYTKNDWRNRNKIYTKNGLEWLTLPCGYDISRKISEVRFNSDIDWASKHWKKLLDTYNAAPFFDKYKDFLTDVYLEHSWQFLSELNQHLIKHISKEFLGITTTFSKSTDYNPIGQRHEKVLDLLKQAGASEYISGPAAKSYIIEDDYKTSNIKLTYKDYNGYPQYRQLYEPFEGGVSILDLLFNVGDDAPYYIWEWRNKHENTR